MALICIVYSWIRNNVSPYPSSLNEISYTAGQWTIYENENEYSFEKHRVFLEAGICFLLEFFNAEERKLYVIFFDQLSVDNYRQLKLIEKIN